jgi:GNAT superfamily N-acetyltransferase
MAIEVRWATSQDEATVPLPKHVSLAVWKARLRGGHVAIALDQSVVGSLHLEYLWGTKPFIGLIYVAPDHRMHGVGRALLGFVETELRAAGYDRLLSSAQADELTAQAWHRRVGFTDCGMISGVNAGLVDEVFFIKPLVAGA